MIPKVRERNRAEHLRRKGFTYNEILKEVPVAKSTLSEWLKDFPLTTQEKAVLRNRKDSNISKGRIRAAAVHHLNRLERDKILFQESKEEFKKFVNDPLFQIGIGLYWAEGSKRDPQFQFMNSDASMVNVMLLWIEKYLCILREDVKVRLYIHKPYREENCEKYWSNVIQVPLENFQKTIYKPTSLGVKKRPSYKGCLRIEVSGVENFRKIKFWIELLVMHYKKL